MAPEAEAPAEPTKRPRRRRLTSLAFLVFGLSVAFYLAWKGPRDQHVRYVLGAAAERVESLEVEYTPLDDHEEEVARETRMTFAPGAAPRVVAHDPELPDGDYRLRIEVGTREGRRSVERQVTLSGGTTSVDLVDVLTRAP